MKTSELIGPALDWAVAKAEGLLALDKLGRKLVDGIIWADGKYSPSTDWSQGGPIIERMILDGLWLQADTEYPERVLATMDHYGHRYYGPTPLIAAMRAYVQKKLGDEIEIPGNLK